MGQTFGSLVIDCCVTHLYGWILYSAFTKA